MRGNVRSVFGIIFLSIITCGIYHLYWLYATTTELNDYIGDNDTSGGLVILYGILTCGIYIIYWYYKIGKRVLKAQKIANQEQSDESVLYLILVLFGLSIVSSAIIQSNLNKIWRAI